MTCAECTNWTLAKKITYDDGYEVETYRAPDGKGHCETLNIDTMPDFSCKAFAAGANQVHVTRKPGAPWHYWTMIACPDCKGVGSASDRPDDRCAGTGKVRLYDDGYIGDERTRKHPKEQATAPKPQCPGCGRPIVIDWVHCPACGRKLEPTAAPEVVATPNTFQQGGAN